MRHEGGKRGKKSFSLQKSLQRDHIHCSGVHFISYTSEDSEKCGWEFLTVQCSQLIINNLKRHWHLLSGEKRKNVGGVGRGVETKSVWILLSVTESIAGNLLSEKCGIVTFCVSRHPNLAWYFMLPAPPTCTPEASFLLLKKRLRGKVLKKGGWKRKYDRNKLDLKS